MGTRTIFVGVKPFGAPPEYRDPLFERLAQAPCFDGTARIVGNVVAALREVAVAEAAGDRAVLVFHRNLADTARVCRSRHPHAKVVVLSDRPAGMRRDDTVTWILVVDLDDRALAAEILWK